VQEQLQGVDFVHLQFIDIPGSIKGISIPVGRLERCLAEGEWFDGSSIEGEARLAESDLFLHPDMSTLVRVPWEQPGIARVFCDVRNASGEPFLADPRHVLRRATSEAAELGLTYRVGAEVEFYLFEDPTRQGARPGRLKPVDSRSYFELPVEQAGLVCHGVASAVETLGYQVSGTHHEVSPGQFEIDLGMDDAMRTADAIVAIKLAARSIAARRGLLATFMPKPLVDASGSGIHLNQIVLDPDGRNALGSSSGDHHLSANGRYFVAGQLAHARGMCAILAPLVNSYKRLHGADEAPSRVTWATTSRNALIRVPDTGNGDGAVVEVRAPDSACNPYLTFAVLLQAGLDGIRQRIPLPPSAEPPGQAGISDEVSDLLPAMLDEALEELGWDMVIRGALGQPVFERFAAAKEREWLAYRRHISDWEISSYLEI